MKKDNSVIVMLVLVVLLGIALLLNSIHTTKQICERLDNISIHLVEIINEMNYR